MRIRGDLQDPLHDPLLYPLNVHHGGKIGRDPPFPRGVIRTGYIPSPSHPPSPPFPFPYYIYILRDLIIKRFKAGGRWIGSRGWEDKWGGKWKRMGEPPENRTGWAGRG